MRKRLKILLLGDSIRLSYQPLVADLLKNRALVSGPAENCQFSGYTLANLDGWLKELGTPDIVHWNNGLHDAGHNPDRVPIQYPVDVYISNLSRILKKLRSEKTTVIWATTTPVHYKRPFDPKVWSWDNKEIDYYNKEALKLMKIETVPVNDLHSVVFSNIDRYLCDDMLHLSEEGKQKCAQAVVSALSSLDRTLVKC